METGEWKGYLTPSDSLRWLRDNNYEVEWDGQSWKIRRFQIERRGDTTIESSVDFQSVSPNATIGVGNMIIVTGDGILVAPQLSVVGVKWLKL